MHKPMHKRCTLALAGITALTCLSLTPAVQAAGYTQTKYPIVLVHGLTGFDSIAGLYDYFYTVPFNLERSGAKVYIASVAAFNSSEQRGAELVKQMTPWATANGGKVNLIGHSQGSPTARVAAGLRPDLVASVTSVGGVNKGTKVADAQGTSLYTAAISNAVGYLVGIMSGNFHQQDAIAALNSLTTRGSATLTSKYPWGVNTSSSCAKSTEVQNVKGYSIRYYSWTGNAAYTNALDLVDPFLVTTSALIGSEKNDGLVGICSSYLGQVIGDSYNMNHMDEVNQMSGIRGLTDPVALYRQHANRLQLKGL